MLRWNSHYKWGADNFTRACEDWHMALGLTKPWNRERLMVTCRLLDLTPYQLGAICAVTRKEMTHMLVADVIPRYVALHFLTLENWFLTTRLQRADQGPVLAAHFIGHRDELDRIYGGRPTRVAARQKWTTKAELDATKNANAKSPVDFSKVRENPREESPLPFNPMTINAPLHNPTNGELVQKISQTIDLSEMREASVRYRKRRRPDLKFCETHQQQYFEYCCACGLQRSPAKHRSLFRDSEISEDERKLVHPA